MIAIDPQRNFQVRAAHIGAGAAHIEAVLLAATERRRRRYHVQVRPADTAGWPPVTQHRHPANWVTPYARTEGQWVRDDSRLQQYQNPANARGR
jgi:hypothetical protein